MDKKHIADVLYSVLETLSEPVRLVVLNTPCFGIGWYAEESGICPETSCDIRKLCESTYGKLEQIEAEELIVEEEVKPSKYQRNEYASKGRLVDEYVRQFVHELGYPKVLNPQWSYHAMKRGEYGDGLLLTTRASYHGLFHNKQMILRFWTNAASFAIVDIHPVLVKGLTDKGFRVTKIPEKNLQKSKPCLYRVHCNSSDDAIKIANIVKQYVEFR